MEALLGDIQNEQTPRYHSFDTSVQLIAPARLSRSFLDGNSILHQFNPSENMTFSARQHGLYDFTPGNLQIDFRALLSSRSRLVNKHQRRIRGTWGVNRQPEVVG